jgi:hypothetical protein
VYPVDGDNDDHNGMSIKATRSCAFCAGEAALQCSGCKRCFYCSSGCQASDRKDHKRRCFKMPPGLSAKMLAFLYKARSGKEVQPLPALRIFTEADATEGESLEIGVYAMHRNPAGFDIRRWLKTMSETGPIVVDSGLAVQLVAQLVLHGEPGIDVNHPLPSAAVFTIGQLSPWFLMETFAKHLKPSTPPLVYGCYSLSQGAAISSTAVNNLVGFTHNTEQWLIRWPREQPLDRQLSRTTWLGMYEDGLSCGNLRYWRLRLARALKAELAIERATEEHADHTEAGDLCTAAADGLFDRTDSWCMVYRTGTSIIEKSVAQEAAEAAAAAAAV